MRAAVGTGSDRACPPSVPRTPLDACTSVRPSLSRFTPAPPLLQPHEQLATTPPTRHPYGLQQRAALARLNDGSLLRFSASAASPPPTREQPKKLQRNSGVGAGRGALSGCRDMANRGRTALLAMTLVATAFSLAAAAGAPLPVEITSPLSLNSDSMLQLVVAIPLSSTSSAIHLDTLSYLWTQTAGSGVDIPLTAATSPVLTLNSERASSFWLAEGGSLQFACRVSQRDGGGSIIAEGLATSAMIGINTPPLGGSLSLVTSDGTSPATGLTTRHTIQALGFSAAAESGAGTLTYEFVCFTHRIQNVTRGNMLSMGKASSTVTSLSDVILPSAGKTGGTITVGVVVRDARGAQTVVERDVFVGPSEIATSLSALRSSYEAAMLEPGLALATNAARRMYTTILYMDAVARAPLSFEDSNDAVAALYDSFRIAVASMIPKVTPSLSLQAVQGLLELPQYHNLQFLGRVVSMCVALLNSLEKDARMQTEEFRSQFLAIIARVLREIPVAATAGSASTAASIAAAAPLITQAMDASFALLVSQSSRLQPHSQMDITSYSGASTDMSLALFRTDGKRLSTNWLTIPNELGGNMVLNVSAVVTASTLASTGPAAATAPARDYMLLATETHPLMTASLMTTSQPNLISTFLGVSVRDSASSAVVATFDRPLTLSVPYLATKCTLLPSADNLLCAPRCVLFDASLGVWSTVGITTILSRDSIAQNLALCALSRPGLVGVEQQLLLNPFFAEDSGVSDDKNPFSAKGLQVGGSGFYILVSITCLVLLTASCLFLRAVRRANIERRHKVLRGLPPGAIPPRFHPHRRRSSIMRITDYALGHADSLAASPEPPSSTELPLPGETPQGLLSQSPNDSPLASPSGLEDDLHAQYPALHNPMRSGAHAQFVPEFQEMTYPEPSTIAGSAVGADGLHVAAEPIEGSATHTPFGRVLHYGAAASVSSSKASSARSSRAGSKAPSRLASAVGSRAGSMPGSVAGSVHGSRAGSVHGSRAGSTVSSRAVSRRTSPERGALMVSVPAMMLQLPASSHDRKRSFIIGELPNRAEEAMARQRADDAAAAAAQKRAAKKAASSAAATAAAAAFAATAASSSSVDYQSRRDSTKFANFAHIAGVQTLFDPALLPQHTRSSRGGRHSTEDDTSFGSTKAKAIKFGKGMKHQITNVREADDQNAPNAQMPTESPV